MSLKPLNRALARLFHAVSPGYALLASPFVVGLTTWVMQGIQLALIQENGFEHVRPFTIGYLIPVVVLTALGGRFVGVVAVAESALATIYMLSLPSMNWHVEDVRDRTEITLFCLVGVIIVFAIDALRQNATYLEALSGDAVEGTHAPIEREIRQAALRVDEVRGLGMATIGRWGLDYYVTLTVFVRADLTVREAHRIAGEVESEISAANPLIYEARIQVAPEGEWTEDMAGASRLGDSKELKSEK